MPFRRRRIYKRRPQAIRRRRINYRMRRKFRRPAARAIVNFRKMIPGGFGKFKFAKLKYCEEITINAGIASCAVHAFRANCMYDPNSTGVGHQPMGFDEWMARYARFAVISSRCYMRYINTNNANADPAYFCVATSFSGSTYSAVAPTRLLENPRHSKVLIAGDTDSANENIKNTVSIGWNCKKWYGRNPLYDVDLQGNNGASPAEVAFYECVCGAINGNDPAGHNFLITIYYNCAFFDPLDLAQS